MREIIRQMLLDWGEFRHGVYTWKPETPNYIKQLYKGYKKSKQLKLGI